MSCHRQWCWWTQCDARKARGMRAAREAGTESARGRQRARAEDRAMHPPRTPQSGTDCFRPSWGGGGPNFFLKFQKKMRNNARNLRDCWGEEERSVERELCVRCLMPDGSCGSRGAGFVWAASAGCAEAVKLTNSFRKARPRETEGGP